MKDSYIDKIDENDQQQQLSVRNYVFVALDHYKESIVRMINHTEHLRDVLSELRPKNFKIGLFQISEQEKHLLYNNLDQYPGLIFCKLVNQYTRTLFHPFFIILPKNTLIEQVREALQEKLYKMHITYKYGTQQIEGSESKEEIWWEVPFETKTNMLFYNLEYKTSRRNINFGDFMLHELAKGEEMLSYKQGSNVINIGVELSLDYKDDRDKRSNNALKIYSD